MRIIIGNWQGNFEIIVIVVILLIIIIIHLGGSCNRFTKNDYYDMFGQIKEGFQSSLTFPSYSQYPSPPINLKKWQQPNLIISPDKPLTQGVVDIKSREYQQIPLPEGQMDMFANTPFTPKCCPNTYSSGSGCACMTTEQYNYLKSRGGNNAPRSEY